MESDRVAIKWPCYSGVKATLRAYLGDVNNVIETDEKTAFT